MSRCEDEQVWRWKGVREGVKMRRCEEEQMWEKVWRWEGVKKRRCEDEKVWRWEDEIQTPTIGRTLRSDALGKNQVLHWLSPTMMRGCPLRKRWRSSMRKEGSQWMNSSALWPKAKENPCGEGSQGPGMHSKMKRQQSFGTKPAKGRGQMGPGSSCSKFSWTPKGIWRRATCFRRNSSSWAKQLVARMQACSGRVCLCAPVCHLRWQGNPGVGPLSEHPHKVWVERSHEEGALENTSTPVPCCLLL